MEECLYAYGARKLLENIGNIKENEKVLIVTDFSMTKIAERLATVLSGIGCEFVVSYMNPRAWDCQEPPKMIAESMKSADVILIPVSVSIAWTNAVKEARNCGARVMLMTGFTDDIFASPALVKTNFQERAEICAKLGEKYDKAKVVRLRTNTGTDLTFRKEGRSTNLVGPIPVAGELRAAPDIEINVVPLEETSNGKLVIDGSIPYLGIGVLDEPIEVIVKDGYITSIEGGLNAKKLSDNLRSFNDKSVYNIAEFGVGLNPNSRLVGIMLEDEGVFGTVHIGIGSSEYFGGNVSAPLHYDLIIKDVIIELDGEVVQENRQLFL